MMHYGHGRLHHFFLSTINNKIVKFEWLKWNIKHVNHFPIDRIWS